MEFNIFHKKTSKKQGGMPENFLVSMFLHFFNIKTLKLWNVPKMNEFDELGQIPKVPPQKTVANAYEMKQMKKCCVHNFRFLLIYL